MEGDFAKIRKIVKLSDFSIQTTLGSGSFGKVKIARKKKNNAIICVKTMKKAYIIQSKQVDHIRNEVEIISQLNHPMIVGFQGISQDSKYLHIFMEYVPGGQLFTHLRELGVFDAYKASFYTAQVILIFQYLHSKNIIYRDLKPENILIARDGYVKLADFGFAKKVQDRTFTLCGTPQYIAPEILLNQGHGKQVDWWTLGVFLYEMIAGIGPFTDEDSMSIYHNILRGKLKFPKNFDQNAKSLVKHLLVSDVQKRYGSLRHGIDSIKNHRFLAHISFNSILNKKVSAPFIPVLKSYDDTSNFDYERDDTDSEARAVPQAEDPFLCWE